jgi:hypothetical protein
MERKATDQYFENEVLKVTKERNVRSEVVAAARKVRVNGYAM